MILLRKVDDCAVERLLGLAVADTDPGDVMPPGWTVDRPDEFREFYRGFQDDAYEIVEDDRTVGMVRLSAKGETGIWVARCARGNGIGLAALRRVVEEAPRRGVTTIVADTTTDNVAALTILRKAGATLDVDGARVCARIAVPTEPPPDLTDAGDLLLAYLDFHRDAVLRKIDGMSEDELRTSRLPTGWTPLAMVKHLAHVELRWLRWCFRGEEIAHPYGNPDVDRAEWVLEDDDTTDRVREFYLEQCARSRDIAAESALTDRAVRRNRPEAPPPTLAWILFHLLQEYARHVGHLDVARELSDGVVGT
ncbi:GNAT family N-acetyltransferase [Saccharothrix luteola]|uniref:GNAT family N-acetyltransferase n=1 Tax=Saccharothrix luteola TaxID=2893018 RepID=UPI001E31D2C3|nr:GNAT family N-acetyltransferase [Saccharothrix luteola]MCC8246557.1 GNAT family N-acetyltransferase [Saccharothrix luteola]MCC8248391.1 GNAT family N-acetyltransferase [Saccharothrix luteola]